MLHFPARNPARTHDVSADAVLHQLANVDRPPMLQSTLIFDALVVGHRRSLSAFWNARKASGDCWPGGVIWTPKFGDAFQHLGIGEHLHHGGVELGDDVLRRVLQQPQPVPERGKVARQPCLVWLDYPATTAAVPCSESMPEP